MKANFIRKLFCFIFVTICLLGCNNEEENSISIDNMNPSYNEAITVSPNERSENDVFNNVLNDELYLLIKKQLI